MNLDLKMEYCPETKLSYEGKKEKKNLAEELGVIIWVPEQTAICMNALLINIFMIYKYIEIFRRKKQNLKAVFILWC